MEGICLIFLLFTCGSFQKGLAALIQTQQTVLAAVGEDAPLSCLLLETKDVHEITWQKDFGNTERNIGSYSAGLQNTSIVIRNVTEQDEGCYLCLFNTFPDGALTAGTCLKVYELHGPVLDVSRSSSPAGSVVSCSATGRPAPTVTLTAPQQNLSLSLYNTTRVSNSNGTVTVTTTALLSASSSTQVGCSVSVLSAAPRELLLTVPGPSHTSDHGLDERSGSPCRGCRWPLIIPVLMMAFCTFIFLIRKGFYTRNKKPSQEATENQRLDGSPVPNSKELDNEYLKNRGKTASPNHRHDDRNTYF
ncbi:uncharacterized protein V3H82_024194 [Fundulus diaphanus]